MMIRKDLLLSIHALKRTVSNMTDRQLEEYCEVLNVFVEEYPIYEAELKESLKKKSYHAFSEALDPLTATLRRMQAQKFLQKCNELTNEFRTVTYSVIKAHLNFLLTELSTLSIDIQMAQHRTAQGISSGNLKSAKAGFSHSTQGDYQKSILAVDDSVILLDGLKVLISEAGFKFTGVTSGEDALKVIKNHKPDVFILDISMPVMDGYQLAEKIRESGQCAPIIFLTGSATREDVIKALSVGATDFIIKSVTKDMILEKISKYI